MTQKAHWGIVCMREHGLEAASGINFYILKYKGIALVDFTSQHNQRNFSTRNSQESKFNIYIEFLNYFSR